MFERTFSPALLLIWLVVGFAFGGLWYVLFGHPNAWVRWSGLFVLFLVSMPIEAALERRHRRRKTRPGRPRRGHARPQPDKTTKQDRPVRTVTPEVLDDILRQTNLDGEADR